MFEGFGDIFDMLDVIFLSDGEDLFERGWFDVIDGSEFCAANGIKEEPFIVFELNQLEVMFFAEAFEMTINALTLHDAASQSHTWRAKRGLNENLDVFTNGVIEASDDSSMALTGVCEVRHICFENDGTTPRERCRIGDVFAELTRFFDGESESFDELHEEVTCSLRAAGVFTEYVAVSKTHFKNRKPVRTD